MRVGGLAVALGLFAFACSSNKTIVHVVPDEPAEEEPVDTDAGEPSSDADAGVDAGLVLRTTHHCGAGKPVPDGGVCTGTGCAAAKLYGDPTAMAVLHEDKNAITVGLITDASGAIEWCHLPACTSSFPVVSASEKAYGIAASISSLYWSDGVSTLWTSTRIGDGAKVLTVEPQQISLDGLALSGSTLYWGRLGGDLMKCDVNDCDATKTAFMPEWARGVAADASRVYWATGNAVHSSTPAGADVRTEIELTDGDPIGLALDECDLYWWTRSQGVRIMSCTPGQCQASVRTLATLGRSTVIGAIAVDDDYAYLLDRDAHDIVRVRKP